METEKLKAIKKTALVRNAKWHCGHTSITRMDEQAFKEMTGLAELSKDEMAQMVKKSAYYNSEVAQNSMGARIEDVVYVFPSTWDWRNVRGHDWTTPIKFQGDKRSCVAHAVVAAVEARYRVKSRKYMSTRNIDLSEMDVFNQKKGLYIKIEDQVEGVLKTVSDNGIILEKEPPGLSSPDGAEIIPPGEGLGEIEFFPGKAYHTKNWGIAKEWICKFGPIITTMCPSKDFSTYSGGVFHRIINESYGTHAVCLVGYDESEGFWIGKNSWGTDWGENGWFRIKYGECALGLNGFWGFADVVQQSRYVRKL